MCPNYLFTVVMVIIISGIGLLVWQMARLDALDQAQEDECKAYADFLKDRDQRMKNGEPFYPWGPVPYGWELYKERHNIK